MPSPGKKGRRHTRTRRPYERRRRTRRQQKQRGGQGEEGDVALTTWLRTAEAAFNTPATTATAFASLQRPELILSAGTGPTLPNYLPKYLGDIVTNIAVGISSSLGLGDQRIDSVASFINIATALKPKDPELFTLMGELEDDLRQIYTRRVRGVQDETKFTADMLLTPTDKTPFLMIAYANLPVELEPRAPVLGNIKDLPPKTAASPPQPVT